MGRVLVVDDDAQILKLLRVTFELEGYEVLSVDCGEKALEVAATEKPDVVVCDLQMPRVTGLSVLEGLRASKKTAKIPFVLVTGSGQRHDAERALTLGANALVMKPFDPYDLVRTVAGVLNA